MNNTKKDSETYIQDLEDKIVDLSFQLRNSKNQLKTVQSDNYELLRKMIHNLKNPVGAAYSFSEMMLEGVESVSFEKQVKYLNVINKAAKFSIDTLNSVAILNRLNSNLYELKVEKINFVALINKVIASFKTILIDKNIEIEIKLPSKAIVNGNFTELTKAISTILDNAVRYSNENTCVKIELEVKAENIVIKIIDEGVGISPENQLLIFNPFFVVNTYSIDSEKCIGLGLTIAKNILEKHQGSISVNSTIEKGSSFIINLPING